MAPADFADRQQTASRVIAARQNVGDEIRARVEKQGIAYPPRVLHLRSFKREGELEIWAGDDVNTELKRIDRVPICAQSGGYGPKLQQGDLQVPEGFYVVDRYNAWSSYHLSLGVDYPNTIDRRRSAAKNIKRLGGDIFVHGSCVTIGCIPIEDGPIEALYLLALDAKLTHGTKTHVHLFPGRLDDAGLKALRADAEPDAQTEALWQNLKQAYDLFESTHKLPRIKPKPKGAVYDVKPR